MKHPNKSAMTSIVSGTLSRTRGCRSYKGQSEMSRQPISLQAGDELSTLESRRIPAGRVTLAATSITFLPLADAANASCR